MVFPRLDIDARRNVLDDEKPSVDFNVIGDLFVYQSLVSARFVSQDTIS